MNIIKPIATPQNLIFIPRFGAEEVNLLLTNEILEQTDTYLLPATYSNGMMTIVVEHDFRECESSTYQINNTDDNLMYRGKMFATDQTDFHDYKAAIMVY